MIREICVNVNWNKIDEENFSMSFDQDCTFETFDKQTILDFINSQTKIFKDKYESDEGWNFSFYISTIVESGAGELEGESGLISIFEYNIQAFEKIDSTLDMWEELLPVIDKYNK